MDRDRLRGLRSRGFRVLLPVLVQTLGRLPYAVLARLGVALGALLLVTNRRERERSLVHLELAFPEASPAELRALRRGCFVNAALNALEAFQLLARGHRVFDRRLQIEGWENVEREREKGHRLLVLSCHSGFWEILGIATARHGIRLFGIGRRPDDEVFAELVSRVRTAVQGYSIERGTVEGRRRLRRVLKGEGALVIFIDQDTRVEGTWVPFFGRPAFTPVGAARMALGHGMRVVPAFVERRPGGQHLARFLPALELPDDVTAATAAMTAVIEAQVRRVPEQWVWWHRRWRRQPGDAATPAAGSEL
ncbi:MAG: lysophospholipid acyltransferase family protein [Acidobacteriota bacterium]|nr:lysophospholipid acyltransferase family protein [Acidobacteriota bacterium]